MHMPRRWRLQIPSVEPTHHPYCGAPPLVTRLCGSHASCLAGLSLFTGDQVLSIGMTHQSIIVWFLFIFNPQEANHTHAMQQINSRASTDQKAERGGFLLVMSSLRHAGGLRPDDGRAAVHQAAPAEAWHAGAGAGGRLVAAVRRGQGA